MNTQELALDQRIKEAEDLVAEYPAGNSFGIAPTLKFLRAAAENGKPQVGRRYADIATYKGAGDFVPDEQLLKVIDYCMGNCAVAYESYMDKSMQRGETASDYTGYLLSRKVAMLAPDEDAALPYLQMLTDLVNITERKQTVHAARELSLLYGWLLPFAMTDFKNERTVEAMEDYHFYIQAVADRELLEDAITYVNGRLEYAYSVRADFIAKGKRDLIEAHIAWLENLLQNLREMAGLDVEEEYDEGLQEYMEEHDRALAEGNLARAAMIADLMDALIESGQLEGDSGSAAERNPDDLTPTDSDPEERPLSDEEIRDLILDSVSRDDYDIVPDLIKYNATGGNLGNLLDGFERKGAGKEAVNAVKLAQLDRQSGGDGNGSFEVDVADGSDTGGSGAPSDTTGDTEGTTPAGSAGQGGKPAAGPAADPR